MDSRFPTYYLNDRRVLRATPTQFRLFTIGTAWSVSNMTDGHISEEDFCLIPLADVADAEGLVSTGLWRRTGAGYQIADFLKTQTSAASLEAALINRRAADAKRQKEKYEKDKAKAEAATTTDPVQTSREDHVSLEGRGKAEAEAEERQSFDEEVDTNTGELSAPSLPEDPSPSSVGLPSMDWMTGTPSSVAPTLTPEVAEKWRNLHAKV